MKELAADYIAKAVNRLQFNKIKSIKHYCIYDKNLLKSSQK